MAEIEIFHYRTGKGILHRLDARIKLTAMIGLTLSIFNSLTDSLMVISIFTITVFILEYLQSKILSIRRFLWNTRGFLIFLLIIIISKGLTSEGELIMGIREGLIYSWKLFLLVLWGHLLTSTTDPSEIHGAVYRILHKIPFIKAGIIATMISLTLSFIPLLFDQYLEIKDAVNSRLGNLTKNPVKKVVSFALPLLQSTFYRADEIAQAMESRCYSENPTLPDMKIDKKDLFSLLIIIIFLIFIFLLNNFH